MGLKLNVGCGEDYLPGYINIDMSKNVRADRYIKNEDEIRYKGVDEIIANRVFPYFKDEINTLVKWHKMLRKGGTIKILVPHFSSQPYPMRAYRHIGYRVSEFYRFEKREKWVAIPNGIHYKVSIKIRLFKGLQFWNYFFEWLINLSEKMQLIYEQTFIHSFLPAMVMEVTMVK